MAKRRIACLFLFFGILLPELVIAEKSPANQAILEARPLLRFHLEPQAVVGIPITLFVQLETSIQFQEPVMKAFLNGNSNPIEIQPSTESLWNIRFSPFTEVRPHLVTVKLYFRNRSQAEKLKVSIDQTKQNIQQIENALAGETDPNKIAELQAELSKVQSYALRLEQELEDLNVLFSSQDFSFQVIGDPNNNQFPNLTSIQPKVVFRAGGMPITLSGTNFPLNPSVKIGGKPATVLSNNSTSITVICPNFGVNQVGVKSVEVNFPDASSPKNAILENEFTVSDRFLLRNQRPYAVTSGYTRIVSYGNVTAQLNGSASNDLNSEDTLSYTWTLRSKPTGSALSSSIPSTPQPSVTLDLPGVYVFQLRVAETNTSDLFVSTPTLEVIEVKP